MSHSLILVQFIDSSNPVGLLDGVQIYGKLTDIAWIGMLMPGLSGVKQTFPPTSDVNPNEIDFEGKNHLHLAAEKRQFRVVNLL